MWQSYLELLLRNPVTLLDWSSYWMDVMNAVNYVSYTFIQVTFDMQLTDDGPYERSQANGLVTSSISARVSVSRVFPKVNKFSGKSCL